MALILWIGTLVPVVAGELLSGNSTPMVFLAKMHASDKLLHLSAYAVVATIPALLMTTNMMLVCVSISEGVGIALECAQHYVPGRSADVYDVVANTAGVLCGVVIGMCVSSRIMKGADRIVFSRDQEI